ncbi:MAG: hypothetical protein R3B40_18085 [Polyangiales bacterium]|nr:hypothetical protein [Myxococcales bacterium]
MRVALTLLAWGVGLSFAPTLARAQSPCPASDRPLVLMSADVLPPDQVIADALRDHLTAELQARAIDLCVAETSERTVIAHVFLGVARHADGRVVATIRLGDHITDKRVERELDLTQMPSDARPLAVAVAADELLRASWAELAILDAPPLAMPAPDAVLTALAETMGPPPPPPPPPPEPWTVELHASVVGLRFRHLTALGPEVGAQAWASHRLGFFARAQLLSGAREDAPTGSARSTRRGAQVGAVYALTPRDARIGCALEGGLGLFRMRFIPSADFGALEAAYQDVSVEAVLVARAWIDVGPLRLSLRVGGIAGLRAASAVDETMRVVSTYGVGGELALGLGLRF